MKFRLKPIADQISNELADEAVRIYGGSDTWVNNAGGGLFGAASTQPFKPTR